MNANIILQVNFVKDWIRLKIHFLIVVLWHLIGRIYRMAADESPLGCKLVHYWGTFKGAILSEIELFLW